MVVRVVLLCCVKFFLLDFGGFCGARKRSHRWVDSCALCGDYICVRMISARSVAVTRARANMSSVNRHASRQMFIFHSFLHSLLYVSILLRRVSVV